MQEIAQSGEISPSSSSCRLNHPPRASTRAGRELRTACQLNLALCLLKLSKPAEAEQQCTDVLRRDKSSLKAYFRRCRFVDFSVDRSQPHLCARCFAPRASMTLRL